MLWVEIIQVRAFGPEPMEHALAEARAITLAQGPDAPNAVGLWLRADLPNDVSVVVQWNTRAGRPAKTRLGLYLAEVFSQFGWVAHSVWSGAGRLPQHEGDQGEKQPR